MAECVWRDEVSNPKSSFNTGGDLEEERLRALQKVATETGVDFDSLDMVEISMAAEEGEGKEALQGALASCACDGTGCKIVLMADKILNT